jgi:hypothetical protein
MRWRLRFLGLLAVVAPLAIAVVAEAAVVDSIDFTARVKKLDKNTGSYSLRTVLKISDDTGNVPPPLNKTVLRFPKGPRVNARYFKTCSKSKLEAAQVASACSQASRIGSGNAVASVPPAGGGAAVVTVNAKITLFNGQPVSGNPSIVIFAEPDIKPNYAIQGQLKRDRGGPYGYILDVDLPPFSSLSTLGNASVLSFDATTQDKTVKRRGRTIHYIEGPMLCNGTYFLMDGLLGYEGGFSHTVYERFTLRGGPRCP